MSIGIYDADMATYTLVPFNLTAMKLSAYYKRQREMVLLSKDFDIDRSQQFFYIKDWNDGNYPANLQSSKVTYYGHAFTGPQYVQLDDTIECMRPDRSIYSRMEEEILGNNTAVRKKIFHDMMTGEHARISLDGKTAWKQAHKQFYDLEKCRHIMFHDYNMAEIDGGWELVQQLLSCTSRNPTIGMKFPITVSDSDGLLKWTSLRPNDVFYSMRYNGIIDQATFYQWMAKAHPSSAYNQMEYIISNGTTQDIVSARIRDIYHQILISRSYGLKISLKYTEGFFTDNRWARLIDLFNFYQHSMTQVHNNWFVKKVQSDTMFDFVSHCANTTKIYTKFMSKNEMRQLFHFVGEVNPDLFHDFYELTAKDLFYGG